MTALAPAPDLVDHSTAPQGCGYCAADDSDHLYDTTATDGVTRSFRACKRCDAIFLAPRPTTAELAAAYSAEYYGPTRRKFLRSVEHVIDRFRSSRARRIAATLPQGGRVLDIGCGNGGFLESLAALGIDAHGTELPGGSARRACAIPNITVHVGSIESSDYVGERFDAITMWHVFEHLEDPQAMLDTIASMLDRDGRLYLSLPNPHSLQAKAFKGDWLHHDPPRHLFYLGPKALKREIEARGFVCESTSFHSLEHNPFGIVQSLFNRVLPDRDVLYESLKGNRDVVVKHGSSAVLAQKAAAVLLAPVAVVAATLESMAGRGATMELVFVRTETKERA